MHEEYTEELDGPSVSTTAPEEDAPAVFAYEDDSPNLAVEFMAHPDGVEALRKLVMRVRADFDDAWDASEDYRKQMADDYCLFTGDLPLKEAPFQHSANAHIPIMLENITRLWARCSSELFGDGTSFFGVTPMGMEDEVTADILSKHGNWQLNNQITDFKRQMNRAMMMFLVNGDVTCHSYWDPTRKMNRHDVLNSDEFVVPLTSVSTQPDYSDMPFYCKVMSYQRHELQGMRDIWVNVDKLLKNDAAHSSDPDAPLSEAIAQAQGIAPMESSKRAAYKIVQFEGWLDGVPNQTRDRFVKFIFEHATSTVLHMSFHEEDDWQDRLRHKRETAELAQYRDMHAQYAAQQKAMEDSEKEHVDTFDSPYTDPFQKAKAKLSLDAMRAMPFEPPPQGPSWMMNPANELEEPQPMRKVPIRMYTHGVCIEPLTGVMGLGYGKLRADANRVANVTTSQFIDAATMANGGVLVTPSTFTFDGGFSLRPGKQLKINGVTGQDIKDSIFQLQFPPANGQLLEVAKWATEFAQAACQAPDVLSGEAGKSGETFRGINSRIEQATKQLSVVTRKFADFVVYVLKNNARLNSMFLADEEIVNVTDRATLVASPVRVSREMYDREYRVEFKSDLRFTSQAQRISEADEVLQLALSNPMLSTNMAFIYAATRKCLEARGRQDMVQLLGPPPPPNQAPMTPPMPQEMPPGLPGAAQAEAV